jgi:hypothetical protein
MDLWYSTNEIARAIVEERLMTAEKERLSKSARIHRKMRDLAKGVLRN